MSHIQRYMTVRACLFVVSMGLTCVATASGKPNIVLILADDLGFSDIGCYGGEIETPNLNRLAEKGMRFTQFYNAARCCPTRASLLTGLYPHQAGIGHMTYDAGAPGYEGELNRDAPTLAEALGAAGYHTMMCGKWHVTANTKPDSPQDNWPLQRGFDQFFGTLPGHGSQWEPAGLFRGNDPVQSGDTFFYTDAIADNAARYIEDAARIQRPFFLYVAFTAPHFPLHARQRTIEKYDGIYDAGWDEVRRQRHERLLKLGIISGSYPLPPRDEASIPWADEPNKRWQAHRMQVYAAMVDEMDQAIGRIMEALEKAGQAENTLVVFLSDNGASPEGHRDNKIERLNKPWESSLIPKETPQGLPVLPGDFPNLDLGPANTYGSYGLRWASLSNTPFRRHKSWVHEGGISTPCIMYWPDKIQDAGGLRRAVAHIIDLMPTFLELAGAEPPKLEGKSLTGVLKGNTLEREYLCWEHEGNRAVRQGPWKLVSEFPGTWSSFYPYPKRGNWELYNLENDRAELDDLADKYPDIVARLSHTYAEWARRCGVVPWEKLEGKQD